MIIITILHIFNQVQERLSTLSRDMKDIKRFKLNFLENTMMEMKVTLGRIDTRVDTTEEKTGELEDIAIEDIQD